MFKFLRTNAHKPTEQVLVEWFDANRRIREPRVCTRISHHKDDLTELWIFYYNDNIIETVTYDKTTFVANRKPTH